MPKLQDQFRNDTIMVSWKVRRFDNLVDRFGPLPHSKGRSLLGTRIIEKGPAQNVFVGSQSSFAYQP